MFSRNIRTIRYVAAVGVAISAVEVLQSNTKKIHLVAHADATKIDIAAVKKDIVAAIDADSESRGDGTSMGPTLVRLAWHASGTYSAKDKSGDTILRLTHIIHVSLTLSH